MRRLMGMVFQVGRASAALLLMTGVAAAAPAERRVALVIGNDAYRNVSPLHTAVNDARAVAKTLEKTGFEVITRENADRRTMISALSEFTAKIVSGGVGLFYYAGHAVQIGNGNYLIAVDAPALSNQEDLRDESIDLGRVLERLSEAKAKLDIVILDACRDNPFPKVPGRGPGTTRGLTSPGAPNGVLIVYSAGVNQSALDSLGPEDKSQNGLFTRMLLPVMEEPGLRLDEAVRRIKRDVAAASRAVGSEQNPAIYDQTDGDFYFVPPLSPSPAPPVQAALPASGGSDPTEITFWNSVKDSSDAEQFREYLRKFPNGMFAGLAGLKIKQLSASGAKPTAAPPQGTGDAAELAFWNSIKDSGDADHFREYLRQFPNGKFAGLARLQIRQLTEAPALPKGEAVTREPEPVISAEDAYRKGREAYLRKDYRNSVRWYRQAAEEGQVEAQVDLGVDYLEGRGVPKDAAQARSWFSRAAAQGSEPAAEWLRRLGATAKEAADESTRAPAHETSPQAPPARGGDAADLAFWDAIKSESNPEAYRAYLRQFPEGKFTSLAALKIDELKRSTPPAQPAATLASRAAPGVAVEDAKRKGEDALGKKDFAEALRSYRLAAEQGDALAEQTLGVLYGNGLGIAKDSTEALRWHRMAADQGLAQAQNCVGLQYEKGWGVQRDYAEAMRWFLKAANQGNFQAQKNISFLYANGLGVTTGYYEAYQWFSKDSDPKASARTGPLAKYEACRISE